MPSVRRGSGADETQTKLVTSKDYTENVDGNGESFDFSEPIDVQPEPGTYWKIHEVYLRCDARSRNSSGDEIGQSQVCVAALSFGDELFDEEPASTRYQKLPAELDMENDHILGGSWDQQVPYNNTSTAGALVWGGPNTFEDRRAFDSPLEVEDTEELSVLVANDFPHSGQVNGSGEEQTFWNVTLRIVYTIHQK